MSFGDDSTLLSGGSKGELIVTLALGKSEVSSGESVPFTVSLEHTFPGPASVTSFLDTNRSVKITLKSTDRKSYTADQMSHRERDGMPPVERHTPEGLSLAPGEKLVLRGDLLKWFGSVPPGQYQAEATYTGILRQARSRPVPLTVLPVSIESMAVSQCGAQKKDATLNTAWIGRDKDASVIFSQISSPKVPRNIIHCMRVARVEGDVPVYGTVCALGPDCPYGAVYWMKDSSELFFAITDTGAGGAERPVRVKLSFEAKPSGSPLLLEDRTLLIPFVLKENDEIALVKISPSGEQQEHRYVIEGISGAGERSVFWEEDKKLHLFWLQGKTCIRHAVLSLNSLDKGFSAPDTIDAGAQVVHFIPYLDSSIPVETLQSLYLGVGDPVEGITFARIKLWCVSLKPEGFSCAQIDVGNGSWSPAIVLKTRRAQGLRFVGSAVTNEYGLALLTKDTEGKFFYGSTMRGGVGPLDAVTKDKVRPGDSPAVVASRTASWVYLQYVRKGKSLEYIRLEPGDEPDPVEMWREGR